MSNPHQELASPDQPVSGKDSSNPLMADNLPKIIWYSTHHVTLMKSWLVQKQTALSKDKSNPLIVDSLLKTIWSSIHHLLINEVLTIPGQMATGKEISNPFMAGVNTPRCDKDMLDLIELMVFLLPSDEKVRVEVYVVDLQVFAVRLMLLLLILKFLLFGLTNWCCSLSVVSSVKYALTVNPNIYVSCIKQIWTTVAVKKVNDVIRLQALVDKKKAVVTEATIREALRLDDAEGVEYLSNEEIFAELAKMGYEKPSTKLTFYKKFFSSRWKIGGLFVVAFWSLCSSLRFAQAVLRCILCWKRVTAFCRALRFAYLKIICYALLRTNSAKLKTALHFVSGSKDRPPMLAARRYPQWRSRFLWYIDTRPNGKALRKCILSGPNKPTTVLVQAVDATDDSPAVPEHTTVETPMNMSPENKAHFLLEKEAIHLILTGIGDEIYLTVNVQFLQQLQPEWSMFVAIVKQQHKLDKVSYHKLFDILKQYQNEVNELRDERLARNANPLALVATAQANRDPYYQASRDKDMQKNLALIAKYFKKIYKPINNNLKTSSKSKNKNVDTTLQYKNDDHSGQFGTQRIVNVAGTREKVGSPVVQKSEIQCFNYKEYGHFSKECRKPKRYDWLADSNEEVDEQELEAHYSYMAKIQEVPTADSVETDDSNVIPDSPDICEDDIQNEQNDVESDDERVALANLKLDVVENKKIQKQLKKANTTLAQELKECKAILAKTSKSLEESISVRDSYLVALQTKQTEFEKYKTFNDRTIDYDKLERKLNEDLGQLAKKDTVIREALKTKAYELLVVKEKHDELMKQSLLTKSHYEGLVKQKTKVIADLKLRQEHDIEKTLSILIPDGEETLALKRESRSKLNKDSVRLYDYTKLNSLYEIFKPPTQEYEIQLAHANEIRRKMWRKSFVKSKPNIYKKVRFLPVSKSISKSRQTYNVMTNNINHFEEIVDNAWIKYSKDQFRAPTAQDMKILIQTCLMPLVIKTQNDSFKFVHEFKQEMHADLKYVESLEKGIDELESDKAEFSDIVLLVLVVEGWSRLPPFQYRLTRSKKDDRNVLIFMRNETRILHVI
nr:hypothetical protein [Tanacetum cinerariifolium]